jgi:hypothetical protein
MDLDKDKFIKFYLIIQLHCRDGVGNLQSGWNARYLATIDFEVLFIDP